MCRPLQTQVPDVELLISSVTSKRWWFSLLADGRTGMGREKEGILVFFHVLLYHSVVCPGEKSELCVPQGWWSLNGPSILCNRLLWKLQICDVFQTSSSRSTIPPRSQAVTCSATSGEAFKSGFLALAKWVWDFYCYFVKCHNDFWMSVMLVVSVSLVFQCLKTCRGKCSLSRVFNFFYFFLSYTFSTNASLGTREIEVGVCFVQKKNNILFK